MFTSTQFSSEQKKEFKTITAKTEVQNLEHALSALQMEDFDISQWLPNSGASSHITDDLSLFDNYIVYHGSDIVMIGNNKSLPIKHVGQVTLSTSYGSVLLK